MNIYRTIIIGFVLSLLILPQQVYSQDKPSSNLRAKAQVIDKTTIKLRWAPSNPKSWLEGKKYGYKLERYTLIKDSVYQTSPSLKLLADPIKVAPLNNWEQIVHTSDYAAVIAQAFYGEDFSLVSSGSSDLGSIINQANELEQRFATSVFMAEYDYQASILAGWGFTDHNTNINEQYLYRIILNRPEAQEGDTTAVFIGYVDKRDLPKPLQLDAVWGDQSVMLSWNYELLSSTYHSYHVERSINNSPFTRITNLAQTALTSQMTSLFYTDSLANNTDQYSYRVIGITSFDQEGPYSDTIIGKGKNVHSCIPNIISGEYISPETARLYWEITCPDQSNLSKYKIERSETQDGEYHTIKDDISINQTEVELSLKEEKNYLKITAVSKDSISKSSFPFALHQIDSIPPDIPSGLRVNIDTLGVAFLYWEANQEKDLRGYRILRSFTPDGEKSSVTPQLIEDNYYFDTLSMKIANEKVYYSITAVDLRYNESDHCPTVAALKPNESSLIEPRILSYDISDQGTINLSWYADSTAYEISYQVFRQSSQGSSQMIFQSDASQNSFEDEVPQSGDYSYWVEAQSKAGQTAKTPQPLNIFIPKREQIAAVSNFTSYINEQDAYIELSWKKNPKAQLYRIYKQEADKAPFLWKEVDASQNRVVDERISVGTEYSYTIIYLLDTGFMSESKTLVVNF